MSGGSAPRLAPPPVPVHTERLTLRYITSDDLDALRTWSPRVLQALERAGLRSEALDRLPSFGDTRS